MRQAVAIHVPNCCTCKSYIIPHLLGEIRDLWGFVCIINYLLFLKLYIFIQEMERVWSQYERMESELSVIRSHLQHICNFGIPQVFYKIQNVSFFTKIISMFTNHKVSDLYCECLTFNQKQFFKQFFED